MICAGMADIVMGRLICGEKSAYRTILSRLMSCLRSRKKCYAKGNKIWSTFEPTVNAAATSGWREIFCIPVISDEAQPRG